MKMKRNPITNAVQKALFTGFIASSTFGTVAVAQDGDDSVDEQGKITVTGSRIKRTDVEGALPVTVISREQIELSGESNAADLLRNTTFNSFGSFRPQSGSTAQGTASVSLRGIGASRTLVLIDGRRLPRSPSTGSSQDLNTIPIGAIERVEILSDGASAIYGSDAIGGVINIITRSDYEGAEIMLGGQEVSIPANGGERSEGHAVFGAASDRSNIIGGVSWNDREIVFARDFPWTQPGVSTFGNNFRRVSSTGGETGPFIPATVCEQPGAAYYQTNPGAANNICSFDFTSVSADEASTENKSLFVKARHEINDNWELFATGGYYRTESFGRYAPVPDGSRFNGVGPLSIDSINNPSNPNSPLYDPVNFPTPEAVHFRHRFDALGNRDSTVVNDRTSFELGAIGQIGEVTVDFGVTRNNNRTNELGRNYLLRSAAAVAVENGSYSLANPYSADPAVLDSLRVTTNRDGRYDEDSIFANASFDLFEMANGAVSMAVGAEYREEKYADIYDTLSAAGQVGGSAGASASGGRDLTSIFFEGLVPVLDNLELSLAGRYDDYSDFGSEFSPRVSLRYQPLDNLTIRGSYGQGFRAPTLDILTQQPSFAADSIRDATTCQVFGLADNCTLQTTATVVANSSLQAETSDQFSAGFVYEPVDWMNVTLDYYNIEIDNRIRAFTSQFIIDEEQAGNPVPLPLGVFRDPTTGAIDNIVRGFGNEGDLRTSGIDMNMRFTYEALAGSFAHNVQWSHVFTQSVDGDEDLVEDPGAPADRLVISNSYTYGDWSFAYNLNLIGDQFDLKQEFDPNDPDDAAAIAGLVGPTEVTNLPDGNVRIRSGHVPTWVTHDFQVNYFAPWNGKFTLGVRNAGEKFPPINLGAFGSRDYDFGLYDGFGRVTYFRYTQSF